MLSLDKNLIKKCLEEVSNSETYLNLIKSKKIDPEELFLIPICFQDDLEVSARTMHGIIYLNAKLKKSPAKIPSYIMHEFTHFVDQTTGDSPTQGSNNDDYLQNPSEIRGFQNQTKYISETEGDSAAENYIEKVLEHHDIPESEVEDKKEDLLRLSSRRKLPEQLPLFPKKQNKENTEFLTEINKLISNLDSDEPEEIPIHKHIKIKKIHPKEREDRINKLQKILDSIKGN